VDDYILAHPYMSGEAIAREIGKDAANVRRRIRQLRDTYPDRDWYADPRHKVDEAREPKRYRRIRPRAGKDVGTMLEVVCGDFHVPFHDETAIACLLGYLVDHQPDGFTINGDFLDCYAVSSFSKDPVRAAHFQDELDEANAVLDAIDAVLPSTCAKRFVIGNHEARLERYLRDDAPALHGLRDLSIEAQLRLRERGYEVTPMIGRDASVFVGGVEVGHFNKVSKHSAYTAKALVDERGVSLIQSHTHRLGAYYKRMRGTGEHIGGWEIGCLCDLDPEYVSNPNWSHGFATITRCEGSSRFHVALHEIIGGELLVAGKRY
jgi:hypothetical protein